MKAIPSQRFVLLLFAAMVIFFFRLHSIPLWSSDEGRYGEIAREMALSGNIIVPHFNYVEFLDKPILAPLITALSYALFGVSSFSTRVPLAVASLIGIVMTFFFVRRLFNAKTAELSFMVLATSAGYVLVGRFAVIDMFFNVFVSGAIFSMMAGFFLKRQRYFLASYGVMGLAFLTKGLAGIVLPLAVFFIFLFVTRNRGEFKKISLGWGILIMAAITLPWFVTLCKREPGFFNFFIVRQHFARFANAHSFGRARPFWFYFPILLGTAFPWSFFIPASVVSALRQEGEEKRKHLFLMIWFSVIFLFFSLSRSKLPYYILPVGTPLAVLTASFLQRCFQNEKGWAPRWAALTWKILAGVLLAGLAGLNIFLWFSTRNTLMLSLRGLAGGFSMIAAGMIFWLLRSTSRAQSFYIMAGLMGILFLTVAQAMVIISPFQSTYAYAEALKPMLQPGDLVGIASSPDHFSDFPFHLRQRVMVVSPDWGTLAPGANKPGREQDSKEWFMGPDNFSDWFKTRKERVFLLIDEENFPEIQRHGFKKYQVVKRGFGKILILITNKV